MNIYIFFRKEGFYPVEGIKDDAEVLDHVILNPGTIRVENALTGKVVWSADGKYERATPSA